MSAPLIGLMGMKRAGKDQTAAFLREEMGYVRVAFADPMRQALVELNPLVGGEDMRVSDVIAGYGWDGYKESQYGHEIRSLMQRLGTESIRNLDPGFWVRIAMRKATDLINGGRLMVDPVSGDAWPEYEPKPVVITDCRFPNEAEAIVNAGGALVVIERPGLPDNDTHASENAWREISPDFVIHNDGSLDDLRRKAVKVAGYVASNDHLYA